MLNSTTALLEQPNIQAMLSTPLPEVDPIHEISIIYNVDRDTAFDVFEMVGYSYYNENLVASYCGIATPSYLERLKGGLS